VLYLIKETNKENRMELIMTVIGAYLIGVINGLIILSMIKDGDL